MGIPPQQLFGFCHGTGAGEAKGQCEEDEQSWHGESIPNEIAQCSPVLRERKLNSG